MANEVMNTAAAAAEKPSKEAIISFNNVSKEYTLYKNDQERFRALFFKPRHPKISKR